jgi:hypothetical protein
MDAGPMEAAGIEPAQDSSGWLYAIQSTLGGPIKIGWTQTEDGIAGRLKSLQVGNPRPLAVIWKQAGSRRREYELHREHRARRLAGEWFEATGTIAAFFGGIHDVEPLSELYDKAYEAGWDRGFDDANATDEENNDPRRAVAIEEHELAVRAWILRGNLRPLKALHRG